jgi:hypothetical protein
MKLPSFKTLLANIVCLLALAWIFGRDVLTAFRARSAEVSAFLAPPPLVWSAAVLVATVGALGVVLWGMGRGRGEDFKGYRLLPLLLLTALFFDLVFRENPAPLRPEDVAARSLSHFQERAQALVRDRTVPSDPAVLSPLVEELGPPPYLVRGTPVRAWSLQVRQECQGPVKEASGLEVGTLIYCVAPGREVAWVTLVGLPAGERFGLPAVLSVDGEPHVAVVQPRLPEEPAPPPEVTPVVSDGGGVAPAPTP